MRLIITGSANPTKLMKLGILSANADIPEFSDFRYATTALSTRTGQSGAELLNLLNFNSENPNSYWLGHKQFTDGLLAKINKVLSVAGEPEETKTLKILRDFGKFDAFIET